MPQVLEPLSPEVAKTTQPDFLPLNGTDHVEFYVGNAKQAAHFYRRWV
jgi:4-hydroxyphenylpyruvate dioxygenase